MGRQLIEYGADVNAVDKNGEAALGEAVRRGREDFSDLLLSNGSNPNILYKVSRPDALARVISCE